MAQATRPSLPLLRGIIISLVVFSLALLIYFSGRLWEEVQRVEFASSDNVEWSVGQGQVRLLELEMVLNEYTSGRPGVEFSDVELSANLLLGRLESIINGEVGNLFESIDFTPESMSAVEEFYASFAETVERLDTLDQSELRDLSAEIAAFAPELGLFALQSVAISGRTAEAQQETVTTLMRTSIFVAMCVLSGLSVFLLSLISLLTSSRKQEAAIQATTRRLAATLGASLDAIITSDSKGRVIGFNGAAERVLGWAEDDILGQYMHETFIPLHHRQAHQAGMERYVETGQKIFLDIGPIELTALRKSGEEIPVEVSVTSAETSQGRIFISYLRDMSAQKLNENNLVEAKDRAEKADQAKTKMLTVMSHEMRTPLNGIMGVLDLLRTTSLTQKQSRYIDIATTSSELLINHVNEALDTSRIEAGEVKITKAPFELHILVQEVIDQLDPLAQAKGLSLTCEIPKYMRAAFVGDAIRIRQILTNLVGNAIKFTEAGQITVFVEGYDDTETTTVEIAVQDTGVGIDESLHDDIFQDFFSTAPPRGQRSRGDGLGLPISRRLARLMDGEIEVESSEGEGSKFSFVLPMERASIQPTAPKLPMRTKRVAKKDKLNILVVDDNAINRGVLADMIRGIGHTAMTASDGKEGLEVATRQAFDLIFMDVSMPEMDGMEATQLIRTGDGPSAKTEIIGLTAYALKDYGGKGHRSGMNAVYTKPLRLVELRAIISHDLPAPNAGVQFTQLEEMRDSLGHEKTRQTVVRFFEEIDGFIREAHRAVEANDEEGLAPLIHKQRGSASLLGFNGIIECLDGLAGSAKKSDWQAVKIGLTQLATVRSASQEMFEATYPAEEDA